MYKSGQFLNLHGDSISVLFEGSDLQKSSLDVVAVTLQMDGGGGEYRPVAYTTASVTCAVDGLELLDLLTREPLAVMVTIRNNTTGKFLFIGYISPNSYNQPFDGIADTLTIECVDWLGIAKFVPYRNKGTAMNAAALGDIANHICAIISDGNATTRLADFVRLVPGSGDSPVTAAYEKLVLSEAYMYNEPESPTLMSDGSLSLEPNAMSCYDALAMIAESVRATWVQVGAEIILHDYLQVATCGRLQLRDGAAVGSSIRLTEEMFSATGSNISTLPRYSRVSLDQRANTIRVSPDLFAGASAIKEAVRDAMTTGGANTIDHHMSQLLESPIVDIATTSALPNPSYHCAHCVGYRRITGPLGESVDLITTYNDGKEWESYIRLYTPVTASNLYSDAMVTIKEEFRIPAVPSTRLTIMLKLTAGETYSVDHFSPLDIGRDWEDANTTVDNILLNAYVRIGNLYYDTASGSWTSTRPQNPITMCSKNTEEDWKDIVYVINTSEPPPYFPEGKIVDGVIAGSLTIEIYPPGLNLVKPHATALYIRDLQLTVMPDEYIMKCNSYFPRADIAYRGNFTYLNDYPTVKQSLRFGFPLGEKPYGTMIDGYEYCDAVSVGSKIDLGGAMMFVASPEEERYDMLDRVLRLANLGDGIELNLNLCDDHNDISPISSFTCDKWEGLKVVVAFTKDIKNCETNVTLN